MCVSNVTGSDLLKMHHCFFFLQSSLCLMSDGYETRFTENDSKPLLLLNLVLVGVQREKLLHLKPESVEPTLLKSLDLILAVSPSLFV